MLLPVMLRSRSGLSIPGRLFHGITRNMARSIKVKPKKRGRPPSGGRDPLVAARFPSSLTAAIDAWAEKNGGLTRSEAMRRLLVSALGIARQ